jgi:hypothetical protein
MNQRQAALRHHLHEIPEAEFEAQIPSHAQDDDLSVEVSTFKQLIQTQKPDHRPAFCSPKCLTVQEQTNCTRALFYLSAP